MVSTCICFVFLFFHKKLYTYILYPPPFRTVVRDSMLGKKLFSDQRWQPSVKIWPRNNRRNEHLQYNTIHESYRSLNKAEKGDLHAKVRCSVNMWWVISMANHGRGVRKRESLDFPVASGVKERKNENRSNITKNLSIFSARAANFISNSIRNI